MKRVEIVAAARTWLGTPYRHQHSSKGIGTDCLGLIRGVYRDLYGIEPEAPPPYSSSWDEAQREELMLAAATRHLVNKRHDPLQPGDLVFFRMYRDAPVKHCGIMSFDGKMIHAQQHASVAEVPFTKPWLRRLAGTFMYPGTH